VITGFDRHSVKSATRKIAYVAASRGREDIEVFVESVAGLSQIQNRSGDRKASVEMAFEPDQNDRRAEAKELFRQLQRIRAVKAEPAGPGRVVTLCRQPAQSLEPQVADLQRGAIKTPAQSFHKEQRQKAARRAQVQPQHEDLDQTAEIRAGPKPGPRPGHLEGACHGLCSSVLIDPKSQTISSIPVETIRAIR
jgi:hypothetical protein